MSYQEQSEAYRDIEARGRYEMAVREQGYIFSADERADIKALGMSVVSGDVQDIDAVIAAICTGPGWDSLADDQALLSAVQSVWPTVAAATHPDGS